MTESFFKNEPSEEPTGDIPELDDKAASTTSKPHPDSDSFQSEEGRMAAIMSYIPVLCFIPLLNMRENKEAHFHARQGVLLFLVEILALIFLIDRISNFVFTAILICAVALSVVGIYFALQGKNYKLPIVGDLADKAKF